MCYKSNEQRELALKFESKTKNIPEFITNYFVLLNSNTTKINNLSTIIKFLEWIKEQSIITHDIINIVPDDLLKVTDINVVQYLDGLKNGLYGSQITQSSANTKMNIIRGFWSYLIEKDYVTKNIVNKKVSSKYKTKDKGVEIPTDSDINNFLTSLGNMKNEKTASMYLAIVKLMLGSGIRLSELIGLDMSDLHFEDSNNRYITIVGKGEYEYDNQTKVNINESAYITLMDYLKIRNLNDEFKNRNELFISKNGNRLTSRAIQKVFEDHSDCKITPHMLRHYVGTKIYQNSGFDAQKVQKQLRHKSINTSIKYYVADDNDGLKSVLDMI